MQVSMAGPPGQFPMMKASDGKPVPPGQQQMQGQPQLIAMPGGGMAYMHAGPQQFMQNGQIIFRAPGSDGQQQLMFSPSGPGAPPTGPAQVPAHSQGPPTAAWDAGAPPAAAAQHAPAPSWQDGHLQGHRAAPQHQLPVPAQDGLQRQHAQPAQPKVQAEDVP
jgi:hypothetical protein